MKRIITAAILFFAHMGAAFACIPSEQFLARVEQAKVPTTVLREPQLKQAAEIIRAGTGVDMDIGFVALSDVSDGSGIVVAGPAGQVCGYMILSERDYRILRTTLFGRTA